MDGITRPIRPLSATEALPQLVEQEQPSEQLGHSSPVLKFVRVKKTRPSRAIDRDRVTPLDDLDDRREKRSNKENRKDSAVLCCWSGNGLSEQRIERTLA